MQTARQGDPMGVGEAIAAHQAELEHLAADQSGDDGLFGRFADGLQEHLDGLETTVEAAAVTGFSDLDQALTMRPGNVIVVAGRPAMGKSAMTLGVALANASTGRTTLVHSLEMGRSEVTNRVLSNRSRVALHHLMQGGSAVTEDDWSRIARRMPDLEALPLWMDYTPRVTPGLVRTRIKALIRQTGQAPLVVIDYVQLMVTDQRNQRQTLLRAGQRSVPRTQDHRRGDRSGDHLLRPAQPGLGAPGGQASAGVRPAGLGSAGAGCERDHPAAPRGRVHPGESPGGGE